VRLALAREGLPRCFRSDVDEGDRRFAPDLVTDLRRAGVRDGVVNWLFCSHVLEHIGELDACLNEMTRLLAPGGLAWIQVPQEPGLARSRPIPVNPHRAHAHAWQFGADFGALLSRPAWEVQEVSATTVLSAAERERHGIQPDERYWLLIRR
jgi:2-polyprenyl-3-methyl-5-hydroxy-6-metoxy-1,4-benzoquinol methylase